MNKRIRFPYAAVVAAGLLLAATHADTAGFQKASHDSVPATFRGQDFGTGPAGTGGFVQGEYRPTTFGEHPTDNEWSRIDDFQTVPMWWIIQPSD